MNIRYTHRGEILDAPPVDNEPVVEPRPEPRQWSVETVKRPSIPSLMFGVILGAVLVMVLSQVAGGVPGVRGQPEKPTLGSPELGLFAEQPGGFWTCRCPEGNTSPFCQTPLFWITRDPGGADRCRLTLAGRIFANSELPAGSILLATDAVYSSPGN